MMQILLILFWFIVQLVALWALIMLFTPIVGMFFGVILGIYLWGRFFA